MPTEQSTATVWLSNGIDSEKSRQMPDNNYALTESHLDTTSEHVENVLVPSTTDRKTSVGMDEESQMFTEAFTSSSLDRQSTDKKNKGRRILDKYVRRYGKRHNCQRTKTESRRRQSGQQGDHQDNAAVKQLCDKMSAQTEKMSEVLQKNVKRRWKP